MTLVHLERVSFAYDRSPVLRDVDLVVAEGDFTGIVGPSGSGKSTLLRLLLGAIAPSAGTLTRRPGLRIGYVPQVESVSWSFPVTVAEVVLMARRQRRLAPWADAAERSAALEVLDRLGIVELADRHIRALSGGQQQRVFLARALLSDPQLLVLDEPTSGVDVRTRHEILHLLGELHDGGLAVVLSTHDLNGIAAHCPTVVCLNGVVTGVGTPRQVLTPEVLEATYGAPMDVLEHAGMPVVVDRPRVHVHREAR
ncbi:MAG: putative metal transporter ATP-binding protein [Actinomycetia bacterium]|nr:putative metal transporter ATP-binding protein [Actinomycetes bacterium]